MRKMKKLKQNLSKTLKCLFVLIVLMQPILTGAYAFAEMNRVTGRHVDLTSPSPITDFNFYERVALTVEEIEMLVELERELLVDESIDNLADFKMMSIESLLDLYHEEVLVETEVDPLLRRPFVPTPVAYSEGTLVEVMAFSRTYYLGNGQFETIVTDVPQTFTTETVFLGEIELEIDNTLVSRNRRGRHYQRNRLNNFDVLLPEVVTTYAGIELESSGVSMMMTPLFGEFNQMTTYQNAALYVDILDGIDVQYTVGTTSLHQAIVVNHFTTKREFAFDISLGFNQTLEKNYDGDLLLIEHGEVIGYIMAPSLTDGDGHVTFGGVSWQIDGSTIVLVIDEDILHDPQTVFPLRIATPIDISYQPFSPFVDGGSFSTRGITMSRVQSSTPNLILGPIRPYAGCDNGVVSGLGGNARRHTRAFAILNNQEFLTDNIPAAAIEEGAYITEATFTIGQYTTWGQRTNNLNEFTLSVATEPINVHATNWNNTVNRGMVIIGAPQTARTNRSSVLSWDITDWMMGWMMGTEQNNGFVIRSFAETTSSQAEVLCTTALCENVNPAGGQRVRVRWGTAEAPGPDFPLEYTSVEMFPVIERNFAQGIQRVRGTFASGMSTPGATVYYEILGSVFGSGDVEAEDDIPRFPDTTEFGDQLNANSQQIIRRDHNWQTNRLFQEFTLNRIYQYSVNAKLDDEESGERLSDQFLMYQAIMMDTLPRIARHYGIPLSDLILDNRVQDALSVAGYVFFIRNPQTNVPFNHPPLTDADRELIDGANNGRGNDSVFGFDPINLTNGNFFLEQSDVSIPDAGGNFEIMRTYNVFSHGRNGMFGRGWDFAFNRFLTSDANRNIIYFRGDGSFLQFTRIGNSNTFTTPRGHNYTLRQITTGTNQFDDPTFRFEIEDHDGTVYSFNAWGHLYQIRTREGFTTRIEYDWEHNINRIVSPTGLIFNVTTNERGLITRIDLPNGTYLLYEYDESDRLVRARNANGGWVSYVYDSQNRMTSWFDEFNTRIILNTYDSQHRVTSQTDANGFTAHLQYEPGRTIVTDNNGNVTIYEVDHFFRLTRIVHPDGTHEYQNYDSRGFQRVVTDYNGHQLNRTFDFAGNLLTETRHDGKTRFLTYNFRNQVTTETDFYGRMTRFYYNFAGHLITTVFPDGTSEHQTVDSFGNVTSRTDRMGYTTTYTFDGILMTSRTDAYGNTTRFHYNALRQLISTVDAHGNITRQTFNPNGELITRTYPDGATVNYLRGADGAVRAIIDARGHRTNIQFDNMGQVTGASNIEGGVLTYQLDGNGNIISETDEEGNTTYFFYDEQDRLILTIDPEGGRVYHYFNDQGLLEKTIDVLGLVTEFEYDNFGRIIRETTHIGTTETIFDDYGNVHQIITPTGTTTMYYDIMDRLIKRINEDGVITEYKLNANGEIISTQAGDRITTYVRDRLGRIIRTYNPYEYYTETIFDAVGNVIKTIDELERVTENIFDNRNRSVKTIYPDGTYTTRTFDANSNITQETDARGYTTTHYFNALNLLIKTVDYYGNQTRFTYTDNEQLATQTDARYNTTTFYRDGNNNIIKTVDAMHNTWYTTFDIAGNVLTETNPDGHTTEFIYNEFGQRIKSIDQDGYETLYFFDELGRNYRTMSPSGSQTRIYFDERGRAFLEVDIYGNETATVFDQWGNAIAVVTPVGITTNVFDKLNRLIKTTDHYGIISEFTFDAVGNMIQENVGGQITTNYFDERNRLIKTINHYGYTQEFTFDENGNQTSMTNEIGATTEFIFDALNRQITEIDAYGYYSTTEFDEIGNVIAETDKLGNLTTHVYNGLNQRIRTTDARQNITRFTYTRAGRIASQIDPYGNRTRFYYDGRGNITMTINALGHTWYNEFDALGNLIRQTDPSGNSTRYTYNYLNQRTHEIDQDGYTTRHHFDTYGRHIQTTLPSGATTRTEYDDLWRPHREIDVYGNVTTTIFDDFNNPRQMITPTGTTTNRYDMMNRLISTTNEIGITTEFTLNPTGQIIIQNDHGRLTHNTFDLLGRQTRTLNPRGYTRHYQFDANGNTTRIVNEANQFTFYVFDVLNRQIQTINHYGFQTTTTFDANGNTIAETDENHNRTTHVYNQINQRIATIDAHNNTTQFRYHPNGLLATTIDPYGNTTSHFHNRRGLTTLTIDAHGNHWRQEFNSFGEVTREINPLGYTTINNFNIQGDIIQTTNPNGLITTYHYNTRGQLIQERDNTGRITTITYDRFGRETYRTDAINRTATITYDYRGRIHRQTNFQGQTTTNTFDQLDRIITSTNYRHHQTRYTLDPVGNTLRETDHFGYTITTRFDALNRPTSITNQLGYTMTHQYDPVGNIIATTNYNNHTTYFQFDRLNNQIAITDARGYTTYSLFDAVGREITTFLPNGSQLETRFDALGNVTAQSDANGNTTEHQYDAINRRTRTITPRNGYYHFEYDEANNLIRHINPLNHETIFMYDLHNNQIREYGPNGANTTRIFDHAGRLVEEALPLGLVTTYTLDHRDNVILKTETDGYEVRMTRFDYNRFGDLMMERKPNGAITSHTYDARGHREFTIDPLGARTAYEYDIFGRLIVQTDYFGNETRTTFDGVGQVTSRIYPGNRIYQYIYDEVGNLIKTIDPMAYTEMRRFDEMNNLIQITDQAGNTRRYEHDYNGNVITEIDNHGNITRFTYDADNNQARRYDRRGNMTRIRFDLAGNMTSMTEPGDRTTTFTHDAVGNTTSRTDADNRTVYFQFDRQNNQTKVIHPDGTTEQAAYNAFNQRSRFIHPSGRMSVYHYDLMDNLVLVNYYNETGQLIEDATITRTFDIMGRNLTMEDNTGQSTFGWDELGRRNNVTSANGHTLKYEFDEVGNTTRIIYPDGRYTIHVFDLNNREIETTDVNGETTAFTHNALGLVTREVLPNGIVVDITHDDNHNVETVTHTNQYNEIIASFKYERDEMDRITRITATEDDIEIISTFTYLETGELSMFQERIGRRRTTHHFSYDNSGNRIRQVITGGHNETIYFFYNDLNQLIETYSDVAGLTTFEYDLNGNMTMRTNGDITRTYYHDVENRLIQVRENGALLQASQFDGDGNRTASIDRMEYQFYINRAQTNQGQSTPSLPEDWDVEMYDSHYQRILTMENYEIQGGWSVHPLWGLLGIVAVGLLFPAMWLPATITFGIWFVNRFFEQRTVVFDTRQLIIDRYTEYDMEFLRGLGLSSADFERLGSPTSRLADVVLKHPAQSERTTPVSPISPRFTPDFGMRYYFQISHFVNDINRENTQVLATYGARNERRNTYTLTSTDRRISDERLTYRGDRVVDTLLFDGRTSITALTDDSGVVTTRFRYDPFGNMTKGRAHQGIIFGFNGEKYHVGTGYQFLRARFYDKSTGRFLTRDTFLGWEDVPLSHNRYSFVHNDPINHIDPTGLFAQNVQSVGISPQMNTAQQRPLTSSEWAQAQTRLNQLNYRTVVTGRFDNQTNQSLNQFRQRNQLGTTGAEMRINDATWNRLMRGIPFAPVAGNAPAGMPPNLNPSTPILPIPNPNLPNNQTRPPVPDGGNGGGSTNNQNGAQTGEAATGGKYQRDVTIDVLDGTITVTREMYDRFNGNCGYRMNRNSSSIGSLVALLVFNVNITAFNVREVVSDVTSRLPMNNEVFVEFTNQLTDAIATPLCSNSITNSLGNGGTLINHNIVYTIRVATPPNIYKSITLTIAVAVATTLFYTGNYNLTTVINSIRQNLSSSVDASSGSPSISHTETSNWLSRTMSASLGSLSTSISASFGNFSVGFGVETSWSKGRVMAYATFAESSSGFSVRYKVGRYLTVDDFARFQGEIPTLGMMGAALAVLTLNQMMEVINQGTLGGHLIPTFEIGNDPAWAILAVVIVGGYVVVRTATGVYKLVVTGNSSSLLTLPHTLQALVQSLFPQWAPGR